MIILAINIFLPSLNFKCINNLNLIRMINVDKNFSRLKLNVSIMTLLIAALFGCAKRDNAVSSNYELQKQRSLEIENSTSTGKSQNDNLETVASVEEAQPVISSDANILLSAPSKVESANANNNTKSIKAQAKIEKLKKIIEKKTIKIQNKIEKSKASGLNSNLKLGLILILVGILIAVLLGGLINGYVFGAIGTIIAVIGIVFLILGLLEM